MPEYELVTVVRPRPTSVPPGWPPPPHGVWEHGAKDSWHKCDRPELSEWARDEFREAKRRDGKRQDCKPDTDLTVPCDRMWHTKTLGPMVLLDSRKDPGSAPTSGMEAGYKPCRPYFSRPKPKERPGQFIFDPLDAMGPESAAYGSIEQYDPDLRYRMERWAQEHVLSASAEEAYGDDAGPGGGNKQASCKKHKDGRKCTLERRRGRDQGKEPQDKEDEKWVDPGGERWGSYRDKTDGWIIDPVMTPGDVVWGGVRGNPVIIICVKAEFKCDPKSPRLYRDCPGRGPIDDPPDDAATDAGNDADDADDGADDGTDEGDKSDKPGGGMLARLSPRRTKCGCESCVARQSIDADVGWALAVATRGREEALGAFWQMAFAHDTVLRKATRSTPAWRSPARFAMEETVLGVLADLVAARSSVFD